MKTIFLRFTFPFDFRMNKLFCIMLCVLFNTNAFTQKCTFYTPSNTGLPSDNVWASVSDSAGNYWLGNNSGPAKYDGVEWTVYTTKNSCLPSDVTYAIALDKSGNFWLGTSAGLVKFNSKVPFRC
jgi:ligand-binding sensor domain-containing protein